MKNSFKRRGLSLFCPFIFIIFVLVTAVLVMMLCTQFIQPMQIRELSVVHEDKTEGVSFKTLEDTRQPNMEELLLHQSGITSEKHYKWRAYDGVSVYEMTAHIDDGAYSYYQLLPRQGVSEYSNYLKDIYTAEILDSINASIDQLCADRSETDAYTKVCETISFVQSIPYETDEISTGQDEWPKYPIETLYDQNGDCEDKAILLAGLLRQRGFGVILLLYPSHCAVGINGKGLEGKPYFKLNGAMYYYIETTEYGWKIGEIPEELLNISPNFIELNG